MNECKTYINDQGRCSRCDAEVEDTDKFCHECGRRLHPISKKREWDATKQRHFDVYRRWLDGPTQKEIAEEFGMSASNVALIARYTVGRMHVRDLPNDIRERVTNMLGELNENEKLSRHYDRLKVIRKL